MVENLRRLREPAAWALVAVIVGFMLLNIVRLVWVLTRGELPVFAAFQDIANGAMSITLVALLVALVCLCLFISPSTPRAVLLTRTSALVVSLGTLLTIVATAVGLWASQAVLGVVFELLGGLLDILLKVLATGVLWVISRAVQTGRMQTSVAAAPATKTAPPPVADPPVWQATPAAGSVWRTAAEAASGSAPGLPEAPPIPDADVVLRPRPGAAEAIGWHRVAAPAQGAPLGTTPTAEAGRPASPQDDKANPGPRLD